MSLSRAARAAAQAAVIALLSVPLACRPTSPPPAPAAAPAPKARPRVFLESPSGRSTAVEVELARTAAEQERGLMYRERLAPGTGMLFVFPTSADHTFWMRNTLIPLDMIFIGEDRVVVGVVERAEPLTETGRSVGKKSRWVLEVPGGFAAEHQVRAGDRVRFEGI